MAIPQTPSPLSQVIAAKTYNAAWFSGTTNEAQITNAIAAAVADGALYVFIPANMFGYNPSLVTFNTAVRLIREGGDPTTFDVIAYGAPIDGVTEATLGFEGACNAAGATGGGIVFASDYVFQVRDIWLRSNTTLRGAGRGATILRRLANSIVHFTDAGGNVINAGSAYRTLYSTASPGAKITIEKLEIDGNCLAQTTWDQSPVGGSASGHCIDLRYVQQPVIQNVYGHDSLGHCILVHHCPSPLITNCRAANAGVGIPAYVAANGINIEGEGPDVTLPSGRFGARVIGVESDHNLDEGLVTTEIQSVVIEGSEFHDNGNGTISPSSAYGIELTNSTGSVNSPLQVTISNCMFNNNNRTGTTNNGTAIRMNSTNPAQGVIISNVQCFNHNVAGIYYVQAGASIGQIVIDNVVVDGWGNTGAAVGAINVYGPTSGTAKGVIIKNATIRNNLGGGGDGIIVIGQVGGSLAGVSIKDSIIESSPQFAVEVRGVVSQFEIAGIHVLGASLGIRVEGDNNGNLTDGNVHDNTVTASTGAGITLGATVGATVSRVNVHNNDLFANATFGISISNLCSDCILESNRLNANTSGPISDSGTNTVKRDNRFTSGPMSGQVGLAAASPAATITTTEVLTGDNIELSRLAAGGTLGHLSIGAITNGTSFTIVASGNLDTSTVFWRIVH